jgi:hypothetical protein
MRGLSVSRYAKFIVALVGSIAGWAATYFPSDPKVQMWVGLAVAASTAIGVWATPNQPPAGEAADPHMSEQGLTAIGIVVAFLILLLILAAVGLIR